MLIRNCFCVITLVVVTIIVTTILLYKHRRPLTILYKRRSLLTNVLRPRSSQNNVFTYNVLSEQDRLQHYLANALYGVKGKYNNLKTVSEICKNKIDKFGGEYCVDLTYITKLCGDRKINYIAGDAYFPATEVLEFRKCRPIFENKFLSNVVLLPLNTKRHFCLAKEILKNGDKPYSEKRDGFVWRGASTGISKNTNNTVVHDRNRFVSKFAEKPWADVGFVAIQNAVIEKHKKPHISAQELMSYKVVISLEGNDVATNLKWALASNSVVLTVPPTIESWYCESKLIPWIHYVPMNPSFGDAKEKYQWILDHPGQAKLIAYNATEFMKNFTNTHTEEKLIKHVFKIASEQME